MDHPSQAGSPATNVAFSPPGGTDLAGQTLDDFHILRRLGEGGMGQVYLAEQRSLRRQVALKILKTELAAHPNNLERFKREATSVAQANHPNIVQIHTIGAAGGLHYMALEYIDGMNLRDYLNKKGPPGLPLALTIMRGVANALQRAAELGIIHRDIKPENILLTRKGAVKVADFGLLRFKDQQAVNLTDSKCTMGTPLYMSPEQVESNPVDQRTDIYSFGVTCYHMFAGHPPFQGKTPFEVAYQHVHGSAEPLEHIRSDLSKDVCAVVTKMMARNPDHRYQTARELARDLVRLQEAAQGSAGEFGTESGIVSASLSSSNPLEKTASMPTPPPSARARWRRIQPWVVVGTILLALAGSAFLGWRKPTTTPETPPTEAGLETQRFQKRRELFLMSAVKEGYANPRRWIERTTGLRYSVELGTIYFSQWRLDEADEFFTGLIDNQYQVKEYATLGRLGHAMVLAFQDQAVESNRVLMELVNDPEQTMAQFSFVINRHQNQAFLQMLVKVLDYNAVNCEAAGIPFPSQLEQLRRARPLPMKRRAPRGVGLNKQI